MTAENYVYHGTVQTSRDASEQCIYQDFEFGGGNKLSGGSTSSE